MDACLGRGQWAHSPTSPVSNTCLGVFQTHKTLNIKAKIKESYTSLPSNSGWNSINKVLPSPLRDSLRCRCSNEVVNHGLKSADRFRVGVDHGDATILWRVMHQTGRRIYLHGGPHHEQKVRLSHRLRRRFNHGHRLTKPDHMGPQLHPTLIGVTQDDVRPRQLWITNHDPLIGNPTRIVLWAHQTKLSVQMQHMGTAGTLMQVVHILRYDPDIENFLELGQSKVCSIGLHFIQLSTPLVIEFENELRVGAPSLGRGHLHHIVPFPQTIAIPKSLQPTFPADACTRQHHQNRFLNPHTHGLNFAHFALGRTRTGLPLKRFIPN